MGLFDGIQNWLWQVALKKAGTKGIKAALAVVLSPTVLEFLSKSGIQVDVNNQLVEAAAVGGLIFVYEKTRNFLRGKGLNFLP